MTTRYSRHVLVIEDDVETAEPLANRLGNASYVVDIAGDGENGLSTSVRHRLGAIDEHTG